MSHRTAGGAVGGKPSNKCASAVGFVSAIGSIGGLFDAGVSNTHRSKSVPAIAVDKFPLSENGERDFYLINIDDKEDEGDKDDEDD